MFGFFKKKQPQSSKGQLGPGGPVISAMLLEGESFPIDDFLKEIATAKIAGIRASDIENNGEGVFSFRVGDELFALTVMPPYPASELEGPIATSLIWPPKPVGEQPIPGAIRTWTWLADEAAQRHRVGQIIVRLMDGQPILWESAGT